MVWEKWGEKAGADYRSICHIYRAIGHHVLGKLFPALWLFFHADPRRARFNSWLSSEGTALLWPTPGTCSRVTYITSSPVGAQHRDQLADLAENQPGQMKNRHETFSLRASRCAANPNPAELQDHTPRCRRGQQTQAELAGTSISCSHKFT